MEEIVTKVNVMTTCRHVHIHVDLAWLFLPTKFNFLVVVVDNCFSVLDFRSVFYLQSSDYCFKNWCRIGERSSRCLLSSQKFLYQTACLSMTALVFFKTEQK